MRRIAQAVAAIAAVAMVAGGADAGAAMRVVDVPGVSGRSVTIVGAARLADGGAIVAGTLTPLGRRRARPRIVVVRLRHDGLIETSFGSSGVVVAQLARGTSPRGSRATAVAVDPARGRAWIGAAVGGSDVGAVLALDARGRRVHGFGAGGVVRFDGNGTAPSAIAFGGGRLAVAATQRPCHGCQVLLLDPASGARRGQSALAPVLDANAGRCAGARLDSLALPNADRLVLGGSGGAGCPTRPVVRDGALGPVAVWDPREEPARVVVAAAAPPMDVCVGIESDGAVRVTRHFTGPGPQPTNLLRRSWTPVAGTLRAVFPIGDVSCGALVRRAGMPAQVLQVHNADETPSLTQVPAGLRAGAIYRCKRHVLVVGTRRRGGVDRASVAVTPITRR